MELAEGTDRDIDVEFLKEIMEINEILAESKNEAKIEEIESFIEGEVKTCLMYRNKLQCYIFYKVKKG